MANLLVSAVAWACMRVSGIIRSAVGHFECADSAAEGQRSRNITKSAHLAQHVVYQNYGSGYAHVHQVKCTPLTGNTSSGVDFVFDPELLCQCSPNLKPGTCYIRYYCRSPHPWVEGMMPHVRHVPRPRDRHSSLTLLFMTCFVGTPRSVVVIPGVARAYDSAARQAGL